MCRTLLSPLISHRRRRERRILQYSSVSASTTARIPDTFALGRCDLRVYHINSFHCLLSTHNTAARAYIGTLLSPCQCTLATCTNHFPTTLLNQRLARNCDRRSLLPDSTNASQHHDTAAIVWSHARQGEWSGVSMCKITAAARVRQCAMTAARNAALSDVTAPYGE